MTSQCDFDDNSELTPASVSEKVFVLVFLFAIGAWGVISLYRYATL
jgi:hypothetical protein